MCVCVCVGGGDREEKRIGKRERKEKGGGENGKESGLDGREQTESRWSRLCFTKQKDV